MFRPLHCLNPTAQRILDFPAARELCLPISSAPNPSGGPCRAEHLLPLGGCRGFCQAWLGERIGGNPSVSSVAPWSWQLLCAGGSQAFAQAVVGLLVFTEISTRVRSEVHLTAPAGVFQLLLPQTKSSTHQKPDKGFRVEGQDSFLKYCHREFT